MSRGREQVLVYTVGQTVLGAVGISGADPGPTLRLRPCTAVVAGDQRRQDDVVLLADVPGEQFSDLPRRPGCCRVGEAVTRDIVDQLERHAQSEENLLASDG